MLKEFVDVAASEFFERVAPDSVTRGHCYKFVHPTRGHRYKLVHLTRGHGYKLVHPTRGYRYKLVHPSVRINVRQHLFAVRIIPVWNSLSSNVVEAESISCFKARLSREGLRRLSREGLRRPSREGLKKFVHIRMYFLLYF